MRVVVKQRGRVCVCTCPTTRRALTLCVWWCWFTFCLKVATVHRASWRQVCEHVCVNESQQVAWMDVPALLVRVDRQQLDLKLYCLRGRTVQHKAVGSFQDLMQRVHNGELALNLHYTGCAALKAPFQAVHEADGYRVHQQDAAHHVHGDVHSDEAGTHQDLAACKADTVCVVHESVHNEDTVSVHDEATVSVHDEAAVPVHDEASVPEHVEATVPEHDEAAVPEHDEAAVPEHDEAAVPVLRVGDGMKHHAGDGDVLEAEAGDWTMAKKKRKK